MCLFSCNVFEEHDISIVFLKNDVSITCNSEYNLLIFVLSVSVINMIVVFEIHSFSHW